MNIKLLEDKILVEPVGGEEKTASGVIIPTSSEVTDIKMGKVVAVGDGKVMDDGEIKTIKVCLGDVIYYQFGSKVFIEGKTYVLLTEFADVVGIRMAPERN